MVLIVFYLLDMLTGRARSCSIRRHDRRGWSTLQRYRAKLKRRDLAAPSAAGEDLNWVRFCGQSPPVSPWEGSCSYIGSGCKAMKLSAELNAVEGGDLSVQQPGGSEVDTAVHLMRSVSSTM